MTNINSTIAEIKEYEAMKKELEAQIEALKQQAIAYMTAEGIDEYVSDEGKVTYREVIANRLDTTALKKDFPEIMQEYNKKTAYMRLTVN